MPFSKLNKNRIVFVVSFFISLSLGFSQAVSSARTLISAAEKKSSVTESISYIKKNIPNLASDSEKRAALAFLGGLQEQMGLFTDAGNSFIKAASLPGGTISGLPKKTSDDLILDAIRCALSCGDYQNAQNYLDSSVKNSKNEKTLAYVDLYRQWSLLVKAESSGDVQKIAENLEKISLSNSSSDVKEVESLVLLTLWHITGEKKYSDELKSKFAGTLEDSIVRGKTNLVPSPFWYFVPRVKSVSPDTTTVAVKIDGKTEEKNEVKSENKTEVKSENKTEKSQKIRRQQLGLYKSEENAKILVDRLKSKGFTGTIESEVRPSGTTYYIVTVEENAQGNMGDLLRTAGFECYPVF